MPLFHVRNSRREGIVKIQPSKINMKLQKKLKNCHSIILFFHRQENLRKVNCQMPTKRVILIQMSQHDRGALLAGSIYEC